MPLPARDGSDKRFFAADLFEASRLILHEGWTYQAVIDHFGLTIKRTTLMDNVRGIKEGKEKRPVGRPSALTHEEQTWLAQWILFCWALGLPPRRGAVLRKAAQILAGRGAKFATKTGLPSYQWWRRFSKRFGFEVGRSWFRSASSAARGAGQLLRPAVPGDPRVRPDARADLGHGRDGLQQEARRDGRGEAQGHQGLPHWAGEQRPRQPGGRSLSGGRQDRALLPAQGPGQAAGEVPAGGLRRGPCGVLDP